MRTGTPAYRGGNEIRRAKAPGATAQIYKPRARPHAMQLARASRAQGNRRRSMEASDTLNLYRSSGAKSEEGCHKAVDVRAVRIQSKITRASFAPAVSQRIRFSFRLRSV